MWKGPLGRQRHERGEATGAMVEVPSLRNLVLILWVAETVMFLLVWCGGLKGATQICLVTEPG